MSFKIELSALAIEQYDNFLFYIYDTLKNPQAAFNLMQDFDDTIDILKLQATGFGYCMCERLKRLELRKIHLLRHKYLLVYRIKQDKVVIEGMYHELQDYENAI